MKKISDYAFFHTDIGTRAVATYTEIDPTSGSVAKPNEKINFIITDEELQKKLVDIENYLLERLGD